MPTTAPNSPCINVCNIGSHGWCAGCYRTLNEIAGWVRLTPEAQWAVLRATDQRRLAECGGATAT
jgi:uncharacterized protein